MGYEVELVIGTPHFHTGGGEIGRVSTTIATYDLSKPGGAVSRLIYDSIQRCKNGETQRFAFFGSDGNTLVYEDRYGDPLSQVPLQELIRALHAELASDDYTYGYRRYVGALALLETFADPRHWPTGVVETIVVLTFGH